MNSLVRQFLAALLIAALLFPATRESKTIPPSRATVTYDYDAFGNLIHSTGTTPNNYLFAGEQSDPDLGLYYNRARYLNTATGRFWSMDTYEGDALSPLSLHKYLYAGNDSTNKVDRSGNDFGSIAEFSIATATYTALATMAVVALTGAMFAAGFVQYLPKNPFLKAPDAYIFGAVGTANTGRFLSKFAATSVGAGISIGLQFLSVGGGFEALYPRSTGTDRAWLYNFYGDFVSVPLGPGDSNGFVNAYGGPIPTVFGAVDFSFYAGAAWETKTAEDYAGPFFCVSGARVARLFGINLPPDCTVCSSPPKVNGDPGAYSLTFNVGSSGRVFGTSLTHYEYYGEVKF